MVGWHITVSKISPAHVGPLTEKTREGEQLAVWQAECGLGLNWIDALLTAGLATELQGGGFHMLYAIEAKYVLEALKDGLPGERYRWPTGPGDLLTSQWVGHTKIKKDPFAACAPDEMLIVSVWDTD